MHGKVRGPVKIVQSVHILMEERIGSEEAPQGSKRKRKGDGELWIIITDLEAEENEISAREGNYVVNEGKISVNECKLFLIVGGDFG